MFSNLSCFRPRLSSYSSEAQSREFLSANTPAASHDCVQQHGSVLGAAPHCRQPRAKCWVGGALLGFFNGGPALDVQQTPASSTSCPLVSARRFLQRAVPSPQRHALSHRQLSLDQKQQRRAAPRRQLTLAWRSAGEDAPWAGRGTDAQLEAAVARLLRFSHYRRELAMGGPLAPAP